MPKNTHRIAIAGVAALGAAAFALSVVPADAQTTTTDAAPLARVAYSSQPVRDLKGSVTDQLAGTSVKVEAIEAKKQAAVAAVAKKKAAAEASGRAAAAKKKAAAVAAARKAAARHAEAAASRSAHRAPVRQVAVKSYANNLDGWIRKALSIMDARNIPGSYHGLHKNIMRESSGNPNAINDWDINAINGVPSKGLLQVIPPTFNAYHVPGTSWNIYDPVANITAAANYAAHRYGSIDNVNSAY